MYSAKDKCIGYKEVKVKMKMKTVTLFSNISPHTYQTLTFVLTFNNGSHSKHQDNHTNEQILLRLAAAALNVYFRRKTPEKTPMYRCDRRKQYRNESVA